MIISLDPGYGNTKVVMDGKVAILQSAVAKMENIGFAAMGMKRNQATKQVTLPDNTNYVVGDGAWFIGEPIGSMDYSELASESRRVLFYAALSDLLPEGDAKAELVIGLPVELLKNESETRNILDAFRQDYKTIHCWKNQKRQFSLEITKIQYFAQPVGAYINWLVDENLHIRMGGSKAKVAIFDLGMNTLDMYGIEGGKVSGRYVHGSRVGVRKLLETMDGKNQDIEELDYGLRTGMIHPEVSKLKIWLNEVLGEVENRWKNLRGFEAVIPVGGGSVVLGEYLKKALTQRGANVWWPEDPISSNALGLWKWASYNAKK